MIAVVGTIVLFFTEFYLPKYKEFPPKQKLGLRFISTLAMLGVGYGAFPNKYMRWMVGGFALFFFILSIFEFFETQKRGKKNGTNSSTN